MDKIHISPNELVPTAPACHSHEGFTQGLTDKVPMGWEWVSAGTLVVLPEGGPHAGVGVVNRMAAIGVTVSHAVEQPEPRQATTEEASLLSIQ